MPGDEDAMQQELHLYHAFKAGLESGETQEEEL
jgi:hypothetical protein